ncbi:virulence factor TspB C-terminal domain-related protein, partial [Stutzerimonas nitrititolerans]
EMTDFEKHKPGIEAAVTGDKFELNEGNGVIDVPSFVNQGTRFLPSTCPAAEKFSLTMAGGRSFEISYEPLCRAASDLSGLFVAVATVLAALYVGRSVGGQ